MKIWDKYRNLTTDDLSVCVMEIFVDASKKRVSYDNISYPNEELKQYILQVFIEDGQEDRENPYDENIPEEFFRKQITIGILNCLEAIEDDPNFSSAFY